MAITHKEKTKLMVLADNAVDYMNYRNMQCMWIEENPKKMFPRKELRTKFSEIMKNKYEACVDFWNDSVFIVIPRQHYVPSVNFSDIQE